MQGNPVRARKGIGLTFNCPCGCLVRGFVSFTNPLDGGPAVELERPHWDRTGETFKNLTLSPSIHRVKEKGGCGWHGFITNGNVTNA